MSSTMTIVVGVVVVLAVIVLALLVAVGLRERRSHQLRERFGPEYERAVEEAGDRRQAERMLQERVHRRGELPIRDLDPTSRDRYVERWRMVQTQFVDDPRGAVAAADELVTAVMRERGYPAETFEQQLADVSVDHGGTVDAYRSGHEVLHGARGQVATDDLRQAMVRYRALFEDLAGARTAAADTDRQPMRAPRVEREVT
jgi:hypothetical protein